MADSGLVRIIADTEAAPGGVNEDRYATGASWALVLDGATARPVDSGCGHDVPWLVDHLALALTGFLDGEVELELPDLVAAAIRGLRLDHGPVCDLNNPDSPSSTLAMIRINASAVEYLVLGDSALLLEHADGSVRVICDDRSDHLPGGRPYSNELVRAHRNHEGGFWVASTVPEAAYQALHGYTPIAGLQSITLASDGITRLTDGYGWSPRQLVDAIAEHGPRDVIETVRAAEKTTPGPWSKQHDDATVIHLRLG